MSKRKRYIKKSADGRFFLCSQITSIKISPDKKTKLWLCSNYLFEESIKQNRAITNQTLYQLLLWNEERENYEECYQLKKLIDKIN